MAVIILIGLVFESIALFGIIDDQSAVGVDYQYYVDVARRWLDTGVYYTERQLSGPYQQTEYRARSFFGVTEVLRVDDGTKTVLMNGTTLHGVQLSDPALRMVPTSYYGAKGPVGDVFAVSADSSPVGPKRIAIVGLGAGALATYMDAWMSLTYFEIDPVVIRVATDPRLFTFLSDALGEARIVQGDARLSLADEPDGAYDFLIMDAFSSDSIPVHLLTLEAISEELRVLAPDGVIVFHISNRYCDLAPTISAGLAQFELGALRGSGGPADDPSDPNLVPTNWLVASRSTERLEAFRALGWWDATRAERPFTDDYADLLSYLHVGL